MSTLYLAWAHIVWHRWRSAVLVAAIALVLAVPATIERLLTASEERLAARAEATPLLVGARGSRLDLVMNALYFSEDRPDPLSMAEVEAIWDSGLAEAIPLHLRFQAEAAPVVGTTLDYLSFRGLKTGEGRVFATLGEAVLGAGVARRLGLGPGDSLTSAPSNLFDLAGVYPLKMTVVGVLEPSGSQDDDAVFVDIKTAWVIAGIGHGHDDVVAEDGEPGAAPRASAAIRQYQEITPENVESFHFHGDPAAYPVSAILAVPPDARAAMILRGRYLDAELGTQAVVPDRVISELLGRIFQIKRSLDAAVGLVALAALVGVGLAVFLSLQLRQREMRTAFRLGCRRSMIARLVLAEIALLLSMAGVLAAGIVLAAGSLADQAAGWLIGAA